MPTPRIAQATKSAATPLAAASAARPSAKTTLVATSTGRPPQRSIAAPARGPSTAATRSDAENAANTVGVATPRSRAIDAASTAGR